MKNRGAVRPLVGVERRRGAIAHDEEKEEKGEGVERVEQDGGGLKGEGDQISHGQSHRGVGCREGDEDASLAA